MDKIKIAILGSGNIGTDLLVKTLRSPFLECSAFIGRNLSSKGMSKALSLGVKVSDQGIDAILRDPECCDIVFDATSALSHQHHANVLRDLRKIVIDLTPARIGRFCIPAINLHESAAYDNINMVTCGGQASIPLAYAISRAFPRVDYFEVVSTIASKSAGPATRLNIDEYVDTTERALMQFSNCSKVKAILNLNPAEPCIDMQTTIYAKVQDPDLAILEKHISDMVAKIRTYVPSYRLVVPPTYENGRILMSVKVKGLGDYLPSYAGNLDIINCAAIAVAEEFSKSRQLDRSQA
jgi:acetaldehyde dehydrogenase